MYLDNHMNEGRKNRKNGKRQGYMDGESKAYDMFTYMPST
jgi:hypothetical protein